MAQNYYNTMNDMKNDTEGQWANVETSYQRRLDLIPNLVNTVKGVAEFEKSTLTQVTQARANMLRALSGDGNVDQLEEAQGQLNLAMGKLFGYTERYPELRATQNFRELQSQLEGTENRISVERRRYNETVKSYNTYVNRFPNKLFASMYGFEEKDYFESTAGAESASEVSF